MLVCILATIVWIIVLFILDHFFATVTAIMFYALIAGLVLGIVAAIAKPLQVDKKRSKLQNALNIHFPSLFLSVISGLFLFSGLNTIIALFQDLFC